MSADFRLLTAVFRLILTVSVARQLFPNGVGVEGIFLCIFILLLAGVGFALYGFVRFLMDITSSARRTGDVSEAEETPEKRAISTCLLLNKLLGDGSISQSQYNDFRNILEKRFAHWTNLPVWMNRPQDLLLTNAPADIQPPIKDDVFIADVVESATVPDQLSEASSSEAAATGAGEPIRPGKLPTSPPLIPSTSSEPVRTEQVAPWDVPDRPKRERRSMKELLAGFMLEKNIRWGELASGILIVGSAVGLVVSLRNELRQTIPYFPALMFMLITAAIHGAGIYTLRKWKLRNTSRGVLMIGLLLVPLNFLAACILTGSGADQRELTDPIYWLAIIIGIGGFATMTWFSSKFLLRHRAWPMFIAILGGSAWTLAINRADITGPSSLLTMAWAAPICLAFFIGLSTAVRGQWYRVHWSNRAINRLWLFVGIGVFTFLSAISLIVIRWPDKLWTSVALTPAFSLMNLTAAWLGALVMQGAKQERQTGLRMTGTTVFILGLILFAGSLLASFANPIVLVANAGVAACLLFGISTNRQLPAVWPAVWAALSIAVLATANVSLGVLPFDQTPGLDEIQSAVFSARSGIILLLTGLGVAGLQQMVGKAAFPANQFRTFRDLGLATASVIGSIGCGLALVASFVNPENQFDMMTASCLLAILAAVALAWAIWKGQLVWLPYVAGTLLLVCLSHALLWNSFIGDQIVRWTHGIDVHWSLLFGTHGILLAASGAMVRYRSKITVPAESTLPQHVSGFCGWAMVSLICGFVPTLLLFETGLATRFTIALAAGWFGVAWSLAGLKTAETISKIGFASATWMIAVVAVSELGSRGNWFQDSSPYVYWQLMGAAVWCLAWMIPSAYYGKSKWIGWLIGYSPRLDQVALTTISFGLVAIVLGSLLPGVWAEMQADPKGSTVDFLNALAQDRSSLLKMTAIWGAVCLVGALLQPSLAKGIALVNVWLIAWSLGAMSFNETKSVGSALRWLLPIGGVVFALLMSLRRWYAPVWAVSRHALRLPGPSSLSVKERQQLINWSLLVVVGTVLLISTIAFSIMLLQGKEALGGPAANSWFGVLWNEIEFGAAISFGLPVAMIVGTLLFYAITERRSWLAIAGSGVFQYFVLLSIVLLGIRPEVANEYFVSILQAVSVGMTFYGAAWFVFRQRVSDSRFFPQPWPTHIQLHTLLNSVLVGSLVVLIVQRFFLFPTQGAGWINAAGSPLGYVSLAVLAGLVFFVWREQWESHWIWICGALGLGLTALVASSVDRFTGSRPWLAYDTILCGGLIVTSLQAAAVCWRRAISKFLADLPDAAAITRQLGSGWPAFCSGFLTVLFATRGALANNTYFWWFLSPVLVLTAVTIVYGAMTRRARSSAIAAALTILAAQLVSFVDPLNWVTGRVSNWLNLQFSCLLVLSVIWTSVYLYQRRLVQHPIGHRFTLLPNIVTSAAVIWIFIGCSIECFAEPVAGLPFIGRPIMNSTLGLITIASCAAMLAINLWSDAARLRLIGILIWMLAVASLMVGIFVDTAPSKIGWWCAAYAGVSAIWGMGWYYHRSLNKVATHWKLANRKVLQQEMKTQLPIFDVVITCCLFPFVMALLFFADLPTPRVLAAMTPIILAIGFAPFAQRSRRWIQLMTMSLVTVGVVFLAWSNLSPAEMRDDPLHLPARSLVALAVAMFIFGAILPRYLDSSSGWLRTFREITVATCAAALLSFVAVVFMEAPRFQSEIGCGTAVATAAAISIVVICMIAGLISIAILPKHDPLSLPLSGRKGYVYAAQVVSILLVTHMYLAMPRLFQFGLKQYWPYIAMAVAFGGVAISRLLERRKLEVLGQPLFHTTAVLPLVAALGIWAIDSKTDSSLVMLLAGFVYLSISISRQSVLWGAAAVVFGNIALWLFYGKFDEFAFARHPQLWLIPPAISVLIAAQFNRRRLTASQLATLRYVCVAAIYISSTSEIFIQGFGSHLWPPMILSLLSVAGIMLGIMFHVRAYLYLGSLFLLMSVLSMVAHAQQRLQHTWPWWAFGVALGIAILVMFGLFEKKRNEMKQIAGALRDWEW